MTSQMESTSIIDSNNMGAQREGVLLDPPYRRLSDKQLRLIDSASRELLENPGLYCFNKSAGELFEKAGANVYEEGGCLRVRLNNSIIDSALATAPSEIVLGARNPENRLVLKADEPRARFVSGAETNVWLNVEFDGARPVFTRENGSIEKLCRAAHLADNLEHLDSFIRCVNITDQEVSEDNKDVNKFLASLANITKHVMAGLTSLKRLDDVLEMGRIIAGGRDNFEREPLLSFITCVVKSPLQIVDDTAEKLMAIAKAKAPVVISSCPMAGATGPFDEFGMVAQINAELIAGIILAQLASPGCPVLYGAVPVRTRLDNLNDMYGAPEVNHYNHDCVQMARFYNIPCYSTAGVGDAAEPGIQSTFEKMLTLGDIPRSGAQYIHYAFGLLERTNTFCPEQAILDDAHIGVIKETLRGPGIDESTRDRVIETIREVMGTDHKTFMYHLPLPSRDKVYVRYPLENADGGALLGAHLRYREILDMPRNSLDAEIASELRAKIPGILPQTLPVS